MGVVWALVAAGADTRVHGRWHGATLLAVARDKGME